MPTVSPSYPADDTTADVGDYNVIIQAILAVFNGHIDADNIEPGSLPWSVMDTFTGEIPAAAMEDDANLVKYRDEFGVGRVISGGVWSAGSGLNGNMTAAVVYTPNGKRYSVAAVSNYAFTASKDTYVSVLSNGSLDYSPVANGAAPPSLGTDAVLLYVVVTNGSAITACHDCRIQNEGEIGRYVVGAEVDRLTVANIPTWAKYLEVEIVFVPNGVINSRLHFNNDTGNNYSEQFSTDFATPPTDNTAIGGIDLEGGSAARFQHTRVEIINIATQVKMAKVRTVHNAASNAASAAPDTIELYGKWAETSNLINRIDIINDGAGGYAVGSELIVRARR